MKSLSSVVDSLESNSIVLTTGTVDEIVSALKTLGALPETLAKASVSFGFAKIPGATVSRIEGGFQVGNSFLPESHIGVVNAIEGTRNVFEILMRKGDLFAAANNTSYAQVA